MRDWIRVEEPTEEPIDLEEVKDHLGITSNHLDRSLDDAIIAARTYVEERLGRSLRTQTWDYFTDGFARRMELPRPPVQGVTWVKFYDTAGVLQTASPSLYLLDTSAGVGCVTLKFDQVWPSTQKRPQAVNIRFVAGYASADLVSPIVKRAMKMLIGHWVDVARNAVLVGSISKEYEFSVNTLLDTVGPIRPLEPCDA